ncbi:MAG: hypothetical protein MUP44_00375, partial [Anaerolineales bacterium]|nr:hypothetical protein [Anaerolineales bacterium]
YYKKNPTSAEDGQGRMDEIPFILMLCDIVHIIRFFQFKFNRIKNRPQPEGGKLELWSATSNHPLI